MHRALWPLHAEEVERVKSFKFLGVHLERSHLSSGREGPTETILPQEAKTRSPPSTPAEQLLSTTESLLTYCCCTMWFSSCTAQDRKDLQQVVRAAKRVTGMTLPLLKDIYTGRLQKKASCIIKYRTPPGHYLLSPLSSGKRHRSKRLIDLSDLKQTAWRTVSSHRQWKAQPPRSLNTFTPVQ